MQITELKNNSTEFHAKITLPASKIATEVEQEIAKIAKTAKMPGFRVGKVPAAILKKKYEPSIRLDAINNQMSKAIKQLILDKKIRNNGDPKITDFVNEKNKDIEFTVQFELLPEIKMPDFKKISIEKAKLKITDKEIDEQIAKIASMSQEFNKETQAKAKKGDQVTLDAIGYAEGKAFEGGKLNAHKLVLGSGTFIPGFEDQLIGVKAGEDVSVNVTFPAEYHAPNLAGKPSEFKVKVIAVHQASDTIIDDEFAKKFKCENLEELKSKVSKNIEASYAEPINTLMKMKLFDTLENVLDFAVPDSILTREKQILQEQIANSEEDSEIKDKSEKELDEYYSKLALRRVKLGLMLAEYVQEKGIKITEDDLKHAIITQAQMYPAQAQQIMEYYQKNQQALESLKGPILEDKAVQYIFDNEVKITEKSYTKSNLEKLLENE